MFNDIQQYGGKVEKKTDAESARKAEMYRRGMSRQEAEAKLIALLGSQNRILLNAGTENEAYFTKRSIGKMIHSAEDSMKNGFAAKQHFAVVSDIIDLYDRSLKILTRGDKAGHKDVIIHRHGAPLHFDGAIAYITVKESTEYGKRVHNVELVEIKKLGGMLAGEGIPNDPPSAPSFNRDAQRLAGDEAGYDRAASQPMRLYNDNIIDLISKVNGKIENN